MTGGRSELIITGENKELVTYLSKLALAILEQAVDVKNIKIDSIADTEPNVHITYWNHVKPDKWV